MHTCICLRRAPWPRGVGADVLARLPEFMKYSCPMAQRGFPPDARTDVPKQYFVQATGRIVPEGDGVAAAADRQNFLFSASIPAAALRTTRRQKSERASSHARVDNRSNGDHDLACASLLELQVMPR